MPQGDKNETDPTREQLLALDRRLLIEGWPAYEQLLHEDAIVIVPRGIIDKPGCIEAIAQAPPWDRFDLKPLWAFRVAGGGSIAYQFDGIRGQDHYRAVMTSTYVLTPVGFQLVLHQQTPER